MVGFNLTFLSSFFFYETLRFFVSLIGLNSDSNELLNMFPNTMDWLLEWSKLLLMLKNLCCPVFLKLFNMLLLSLLFDLNDLKRLSFGCMSSLSYLISNILLFMPRVLLRNGFMSIFLSSSNHAILFVVEFFIGLLSKGISFSSQYRICIDC